MLLSFGFPQPLSVEIVKNTSGPPIDNISDAIALLRTPGANPRTTLFHDGAVDFHDVEAETFDIFPGGFRYEDIPLLHADSPPAPEQFADRFTGLINVPASRAPNSYTFAIASDDGFRLTVNDGVGDQVAELPGLRPIGVGPLLHVTFPVEGGVFPFDLVHFEWFGGAILEFAYAPGRHDVFSTSTFQLVPYAPVQFGSRTQIVLDFFGESLHGSALRNAGWTEEDLAGVPEELRIPPFFGADFFWPDYDGDGVIDTADKWRMVVDIYAAVRADFAAYNVDVVLSGVPRTIFSDERADFKDTVIFVSGGDCNDIVPATREGFEHGCLGVAPLDNGKTLGHRQGRAYVDTGDDNQRDNIGFAFAGEIGDRFESLAEQVNALAESISHEAAHTFGLAHIVRLAGFCFRRRLRTRSCSSPLSSRSVAESIREIGHKTSCFRIWTSRCRGARAGGRMPRSPSCGSEWTSYMVRSHGDRCRCYGRDAKRGTERYLDCP